ncbi:MAG: amylo-alpha-1,6-glucosidase [Planctomycetota bacterium]
MVHERALTRKRHDDRSAALADEWLLTAGTGAYAMGTVLGVNTRRYHGLLVAATQPPVGRVLALHSVVDWLEVGGRRIDLAGQQFGEGLHPDGWTSLAATTVEAPGTCTWRFEIDGLAVTRRVRLHRAAGGVSVAWSVDGAAAPARLFVRPLTPLRDFHELDREHGDAPVIVSEDASGVAIERGGVGLRIGAAGDGAWRSEPQWWRGFEYAADRERGQDCTEDAWSPGVMVFDVDDDRPREIEVRLEPMPASEAPDPVQAADPLRAAADQFLVFRGGGGRSIIAGYPWFADWGRDAMISLPGLLLVTGRLDDARRVLRAFAASMRRGLIPNCFDDAGGGASFHTSDASLWFVHAVAEYARAGGEDDLPALVRAANAVIDAYRVGTDFGIGLDDDGLIRVGDGRVCTTWMDAHRDGVRFTPRDGKPVEISALWHHALRCLAELTDDAARRRDLDALARRAASSFRDRFRWSERGCLHDVLEPRDGAWVGDGRLRPNQVIAASLRHAPMDADERAAVAAAAREHLLTPYGLRTLAPGHPDYQGRYEGDLLRRDAAYHNGTVWPWLMGPYCETILRAGDFSAEARAEARDALAPLQTPLIDGRLRQVPEVYDGDAPHRPSGCPAQAWSVAEILRIEALIARDSRYDGAP